MRKLIGVIAVLTLVVAFSAPTGASASTPPGDSAGCSNENTTFSQPKQGAYAMDWTGYKRRVVVTGSVAATFTGVCRGFTYGWVEVRVKRPNGHVGHRVRYFPQLEFKNGFTTEGRETGEPYRFRFAPTFKNLKKPGTCVTVKLYWEPWRFNDSHLVTNDGPKFLRDSGCYKTR